MITELVFFDLPTSMTRDDLLAQYRTTADAWVKNPDLIEKYYFFDDERRLGGGVYVWKDRAAAERWHGADYRERVRAAYGSLPRIQILDALLKVVPQLGVIWEPDGDGDVPLSGRAS